MLEKYAIIRIFYESILASLKMKAMKQFEPGRPGDYHQRFQLQYCRSENKKKAFAR